MTVCDGSGVETVPDGDEGVVKYACLGCANCKSIPAGTRDIVTVDLQNRAAGRYEDDITRRWD